MVLTGKNIISGGFSTISGTTFQVVNPATNEFLELKSFIIQRVNKF